MAGFQDNRGELGAEVQAESRNMGQGRGTERSHLMAPQNGPGSGLLSLLTTQIRSLSSITFKPNKAQPFWPGCWNGEQLLGQEKSPGVEHRDTEVFEL